MLREFFLKRGKKDFEEFLDACQSVGIENPFQTTVKTTYLSGYDYIHFEYHFNNEYSSVYIRYKKSTRYPVTTWNKEEFFADFVMEKLK